MNMRISGLWAALAFAARVFFAPAGFIALTSFTVFIATPASAQDIRPLQFARGASSAVVTGAVVRGTRSVYSFDARKGQWANIVVTAVEANAAISVWRPGAKASFGEMVEIEGRALAGAGELDDASQWRGRLPDTGTYLIVVGPTRGNATFELRLAISKTQPPAKAGSAATTCSRPECRQPTDGTPGTLDSDGHGDSCPQLHALAR